MTAYTATLKNSKAYPIVRTDNTRVRRQSIKSAVQEGSQRVDWIGHGWQQSSIKGPCKQNTFVSVKRASLW